MSRLRGDRSRFGIRLHRHGAGEGNRPMASLEDRASSTPVRHANISVSVRGSRRSVANREYPLNLVAPGPSIARSSDRFRVRECYLPLMLSYLRLELLYAVHARPLVSVALGRDRYSVGYSPPARNQAAPCF